MVRQVNPKRDKLIKQVQGVAQKMKLILSPSMLFNDVNLDDLGNYSPEVLANIAKFAGDEVSAFDGKTARITIRKVKGIDFSNSPITVVSITGSDRPFLYDSIMGEISANYRDIHLSLHPILYLSEKGLIEQFSLKAKNNTLSKVSHIQIHLPELDSNSCKQLLSKLEGVMEQVQGAVRDWQPMLSAVDAIVADLEVNSGKSDSPQMSETLAFLSWLRDDNFTFLGVREYLYTKQGGVAEIKPAPKSGLGILANPDIAVLKQGNQRLTTTPEILAFLEGKDDLIVTKANVKSVVHRRTYMDYIGVKRYNVNGELKGELRIVGLFTSTAYTRSVMRIPLIRAKTQAVIEYSGFDPASHSGKALLNTLEGYPRDELFQMDVKQLSVFCEQINQLADRPRVRVLPRIDRFDRFVSVIVFVPRDLYNSGAREKIGELLTEVYDGRLSAYYPAFPEGGVARVHFIIGRSGGVTPRVSHLKLEKSVEKIVASWQDEFDALCDDKNSKIEVSQAFQERFSPIEAVHDIKNILACSSTKPLCVEFYVDEENSNSDFSVKIFKAGEPESLSRRVPLLENFGFQVINERTFEIEVELPDGNNTLVFLHDMQLNHESVDTALLKKHSANLEEAFLAVWNESVDNDAFNKLIINSGLNVRETTVIRAFARYLRQAGIAYSQAYISRTLAKHPLIVKNIFNRFVAQFDPKLESAKRKRIISKSNNAISGELVSVASLGEDNIIRRFSNLLDAMLRTNYFQTNEDGQSKPVLAFKLNPRLLDGIPEPKPYREIFVYGSQVEGVHLRFGPIARGGLRWSDRAQDYRTEVLGLVKAQQVKNAVIVPVGSKGGFYPKMLPQNGSRDEVFNAGREAYKSFISTLLSITDNLSGQKVIAPLNTVRIDGDDPYFVVAADKGTATFSDTANEISQAQDFWLDDAFASGGSAGYDHKKMGITARGAWEAVKRHFREMNIDIQTEPFTVAGVGDMSGDVFGNGMLLSEKIQLVAAFDHRDIFIDPKPNCAKSFVERKRLFEMGRSSWNDYNKKCLSKGGMIISRSEKSVTLTAEAAEAIGLDNLVTTPSEILIAILKSHVDLFWFGGIGTYIKAAGESDGDVGDRANDGIRIDAREVRAKVLGEGANLGITQRGRIAFNMNGGRSNSDAIDNSAGVNSSDVEVNIKIALANAMRENRLTRPKRNILLGSMTNEVGELVLRNNYLQTLAISIVQRHGLKANSDLIRFMSALEADKLLNRRVEVLPSNAVLRERQNAGIPLSRAEIGVLLSYAKLVLLDEVVESKLPDDPYFKADLMGYFPKGMLKKHSSDIESHRLRREIISTLVSNDAINRGGPAFIIKLKEATGLSSDVIVKAFVMAHDGMMLGKVYKAIDRLDNVIDGELQNELYDRVGLMLVRVTDFILKSGIYTKDIQVTVDALSSACKELSTKLHTIVPEFLRNERQTKQARFVENKVPEDIAKIIASFSYFGLIPEILKTTEKAKTDLVSAAKTYFGVTEVFGIGRLQAAASVISLTDTYELLALDRSIGEISVAHGKISVAIILAGKKSKYPVKDWLEKNHAKIGHTQKRIVTLSTDGEINLAKLMVAAGMLKDISG